MAEIILFSTLTLRYRKLCKYGDSIQLQGSMMRLNNEAFSVFLENVYDEISIITKDAKRNPENRISTSSASEIRINFFLVFVKEIT